MDNLAEIQQFFKTLVTEREGHDRILEKVKIVSCSKGKCVAELKIEKEHTNIYGSMHGGFTATLIDIITSIAMMVDNENGAGVSVDLNISYMNQAVVDDVIVIDATTTKIGRTLGFAEAIITNKKNGKPIAKAMHTKFIAQNDKFQFGKDTMDFYNSNQQS